ncbi:MAG: AbrB/MazE/SpoVT family DNA-binding domain-containing protein [Candidatus Bathyarchaeales archaeon]
MEKDLGYRKIQCTGRGSYIICLPKEWVESIELEKGSEIAFKLQDNSLLTLVPRKILEKSEGVKKPKLKEYWVNIKPKEDTQSVCRKIKALYLIGADIIKVRIKNEEEFSKHAPAITELVKNVLLGAEIIDATSNEITIQILVNHPSFPIESAIKRMATMVLLASKSIISSLENMSDEMFKNIRDMCLDANRLNLYVIRQLKYGIQRNLYKEMGFKSPKEFLLYRMIAQNIKDIAENIIKVVDNLEAFEKLIHEHVIFLKEKFDEEAYSQISKFTSSAHQVFEESIKTLFKQDYIQADKIITEAESLIKLENELLIMLMSKKMDPNLSSILRLISDNARRIIDCSKDIAELTLNLTVEETVDMLFNNSIQPVKTS